MLTGAACSRFRQNLLRWYGRRRRELPWRDSSLAGNAYAIWVSEIMLQQTRVTAVIPYYQRFLARFPDLSTLARAPLEAVLREWSGLGYYRRARQLHAGAQWLREQTGGEFPRDFSAALQVPGVGRYTAGAVLSIAYGQPVPAVDGNVRRVLQRLTGRHGTPARLEAGVRQLIAPRRPGDFNQALMELGALICLPANPRCPACPVRGLCRHAAALKKNPGRNLARKAKSPAPALLQWHYGALRRGLRIWLAQRPADAAWMPGLWELPELTARSGVKEQLQELGKFDHAITRYRIHAHVYAATSPQQLRQPRRGAWFLPEAARALPLTGLTRKILRRLGYIEGE